MRLLWIYGLPATQIAHALGLSAPTLHIPPKFSTDPPPHRLVNL